MKVRNLFLSMCAIAALASCSKNDDVAPSSNAKEARVTLRLKGDGVETRAEVDADEAGASIKDITVFFFNPTGFIVGTPKYIEAANIANPIKTTTDATQVAIIANLGADKTAAGGDLAGVNSIAQLKEKVLSSVTTETTPITKHIINQTKDRLYMSGMGRVAMGADNVTGTAEVQLHFLTSRIKSVSIEWKTDEQNQHYGTVTEFKDDNTKWFAIQQVYLMMSQTSSRPLPVNAATNEGGIVWTGSFAPEEAQFGFAGGLSWGAAPWAPMPSPQPVQTDSYIVKKDFATTTANKIDNLIVDNPWYVFENPASSTKPTGLIVEVLWRSKDQAAYDSPDVLTKYFTIYFGEQKAGATPANQPYLEPGTTYDIKLKLNGSFKPGENGGGGTDDPSKPSVDANITVDVKPAKWTTTAAIEKEFAN